MAARKRSTSRSTEDDPAQAGSSSLATQAERSTAIESRSSAPALVVGVGASAGGLDAFREFLSAAPTDAGIAYVLIEHTGDSQRGQMAQLLERSTPVPVRAAEDGMPVEPGHAYAAPANQLLRIELGRLRLSRPSARQRPRMPIDFFLRSLADDQHDRAVGVLLSGHGSDGTLGLMHVKGAGGLTIVQDPQWAEYDGMPQSAIAAGYVDCVLPIREMAAALAQFARNHRVDCDSGAPPSAEHELRAVLTALRRSTGHEFHQYKKTTLARRIHRRMSLSRVADLNRYAQLVSEDSDEARKLLKDLLIGVTQFFREPEAWQSLSEHVVPALLKARPDETPIRVWVPGCATGEEAYSMAILLTQAVESAGRACPVQVFATDLDAEALEIGRSGLYPAEIAGDLSTEQLERFFTAEGGAYRVTQHLRELVVFAVQNVISDPPFSRLDLISCRNLMIYIDQEAQQRVLSLFHFALNRGGYLFLGPSETIGAQEALFEPVNARWKIYRRLEGPRCEPFEPGFLIPQPAAVPGRLPPRRSASRPRGMADIAHDLLLKQFAPASVLINREFEALFFHGPTHDYLIQPSGERTDNLMELAAEGLRSSLRSAIHRAVSTNGPAAIQATRVRRGDISVAVRIKAAPAGHGPSGEELLLVTFQDEDEIAPTVTGEISHPADEAVVRQLEAELRTAREELRSTTEEMDAWNEELRASNEEVMSMNEELQSTNEELEASKEELQSLNEELATVNQQLLQNVAELERANNDLSNLLTSTHIATLFLDTQFRIQRLTPDALKLFRGAAPVVGRSIGEYAGAFPDEGLTQEAREVLETLVPVRRDVRTEGGQWLIRRVLPYRTHDNRIEGVVITFTDVTELRHAYEAVQESEQRFRAMSDGAPVLIWTSGADGQYDWFNKPWLDFSGRTIEQHSGLAWAQALHPDDYEQCLNVYSTAFEARKPFRMTFRLRRHDGEYRWLLDEGVPRYLPDGTFAGYIGSCVDITERQQMEQSLRNSEERYRSLVQATTSIVWVTDPRGAFVERQSPFEAYTGMTWEQYRGWGWTEALHPDDREQIAQQWKDTVATSEQFETHGRIWSVAHGEHRYFQVRAVPVLNEDGTVREWVGTINDVHEQHAAHENQAWLAAIINFSSDAVIGKGLDGTVLTWNQAAERMYGYSAEETIGKSIQIIIPPERAGEWQTIYKKVAGGASVEQFETVRVRKDGRRIDVSLTISPVRNPEGELIGLSGIERDITERRRAEENQARLAAIVNSSSDAIIGKGLDGTILTWNDAAERMFGYTAAEAIGRSINLLIPPGRTDELVTFYQEVASGQSVEQFETVRLRKDGRRIDVSLTLSPVRNAEGEIIGVSGIERDISERKRIEAELLALTQTLEQRVRERTSQLRALAGELTTAEHRERRRIAQTLHDHIQQILVAAKMRVAMARGRAPADSPLLQSLSEIDSLLAESIEASRSLAIDLSPPVLHDAGLVAALEWLARHMEKQYSLKVSVSAETDVDASENVTIFLFQAVRELLFNVVKHSGSSEATILVDRMPDGRLRLTTTDRGRGFDPGIVSAAGREREGLGLFGIRERLEHLGGELLIESAPNQGARVVLIAPADPLIAVAAVSPPN